MARTPERDHAGNLIKDTRFVYVYDAWNRLVKVRSANDADGERSEREQSAIGKADREVRVRTATCPEEASLRPATGGVIQTAEYDGTGRRMQKVVSNSGEYDKTETYLYEEGWRIAQINDGSGYTVQQFIHGTQYIDEVVTMRVKGERSERERPAIGKASRRLASGPLVCPKGMSTTRMTGGKGDLYLHQDANWNVIAATDLGGAVVERYVYTPYGELTVHQLTSYGDRDGDQDVDTTDKGTVGTTCTGTVSGGCRILDLDFDGDCDSTDAGLFDSLTQGAARHPGRVATATAQSRAHQGLSVDAELASYQNRHRQYAAAQRLFAQRDPLYSRTSPLPTHLHDGLNSYDCLRRAPVRYTDPQGLQTAGTSCGTGIGMSSLGNACCNCRNPTTGATGKNCTGIPLKCRAVPGSNQGVWGIDLGTGGCCAQGVTCGPCAVPNC
ncbi:MAG: hypothetical protein HY763_10690 [Planctomycetes bacterium]|nr:hypothetical protein [Planctomycetota bacterium]